MAAFLVAAVLLDTLLSFAAAQGGWACSNPTVTVTIQTCSRSHTLAMHEVIVRSRWSTT